MLCSVNDLRVFMDMKDYWDIHNNDGYHGMPFILRNTRSAEDIGQ